MQIGDDVTGDLQRRLAQPIATFLIEATLLKTDFI